MTTLRKIKLLLAAVIVVFVAAAAYISTLVIERQTALEQVSRYNVAWLVSQAATEYAGLILCGVVLVILLIWHNSLLRRAHEELHELAGEMRTQNERFDAALNNMSQGLCMVDASQRLIVCNAQYRSLFGLDAASVRNG